MSGSVLDDCTEVRTCTCCIPLRIGCVWIAIVGIIMGGALGVMGILLGAKLDISHLESVGLSSELGKATVFLFAVLNFLLVIASICLLIGAFKRITPLVSVYVWFVVIYLIMLVLVVVLVVTVSAVNRSYAGTVIFLLSGILLFILMTHFFLVANSYRMRN